MVVVGAIDKTGPRRWKRGPERSLRTSVRLEIIRACCRDTRSLIIYKHERTRTRHPRGRERELFRRLLCGALSVQGKTRRNFEIDIGSRQQFRVEHFDALKFFLVARYPRKGSRKSKDEL